ncbi:MAG: heme o synthase [Chitinophagales bacterium]|nr:heme o synthase [Chitinophagales bacterium]
MLNLAKTEQGIISFIFKRLKAYGQLSKIRLSLMVVFSSVMAYLFEGVAYYWLDIVVLFVGGLMVTCSAISINQIIEKDTDKLMPRTSNRPLPSGEISIIEAAIFAGVNAVVGILFLTFYFNPIAGLLSALSLMTYGFIYTPFKRISPIAVFIGAIPGALPLLIGSAAAQGYVTTAGYILFIIQLLWQMPHFWAIAWVLDDDYRKGGFTLLPSGKGKSRDAAIQIVIYNIALLFVSALPFIFHYAGVISFIIALICGFIYLQTAIQLTIDLSVKSAKKLMFASFLYIPIVQIALVLDKI